MKSQQAAEREEQQRIKNLVLNYDLNDGEDQDGDFILQPLLPNPNIHIYQPGLEKTAATTFSRLDKSGSNRSGQRSRKLQLSDVDWYAPQNKSSQSQVSENTPNETSRPIHSTKLDTLPLSDLENMNEATAIVTAPTKGQQRRASQKQFRRKYRP
jgi:regulator of nonsense transcripts 2